MQQTYDAAAQTLTARPTERDYMEGRAYNDPDQLHIDDDRSPIVDPDTGHIGD